MSRPCGAGPLGADNLLLCFGLPICARARGRGDQGSFESCCVWCDGLRCPGEAGSGRRQLAPPPGTAQGDSLTGIQVQYRRLRQLSCAVLALRLYLGLADLTRTGHSSPPCDLCTGIPARCWPAMTATLWPLGDRTDAGHCALRRQRQRISAAGRQQPQQGQAAEHEEAPRSAPLPPYAYAVCACMAAAAHPFRILSQPSRPAMHSDHYNN